MFLIKAKIFKILIVALAVFCLMADKAKAGKISRSEASMPVFSVAPMADNLSKSSNENAPSSPVETVADADADADAAGAASISSGEKQTTTVAASDDATSSLSVWGIVRSVWNWIRDDLSESLLGAYDDDDATVSNGSATTPSTASTSTSTSTSIAAVGRTFGKIRRLQMALIPIIFKFGVLSAMVAFLVVLGMKTLFLLKLLVLMNAAVILGKFLTIKTNFGHVEHAPATVSWGYSNWNPHTPSHGWPATAPAAQPVPSKEIHLHIHGGQTQPQVSAYSTYGSPPQSHANHGGWERRNDPYNGYESAAVSEADVENELNNQGPIAALPTKYPANHRY